MRGPGRAACTIDAQRLLRRLDDLALIGATTTGGVTRAGFTPAWDEANRYVAVEARSAGLCSYTDAAGNLVIHSPGAHHVTDASGIECSYSGSHCDREAAVDPRSGHGGQRSCLLLGSHLDSVADGGRLDGTYGVVAALEVLESLHEDIRHGSTSTLPFEVAVIAFANEEGAVFPQPFWGSLAAAGLLDRLPREPTAHDGSPLRPALHRAGGDLDRLASAAWPTQSLAGYLELHIEQGPVLENASAQIGVVDAIAGRSVLHAEFNGLAAHAGTTPVPERADAMIGAAQLVLAVRELALSGVCQVSTVGRLDIQPNSPNTVAGSVRLTIDLRDSDPERLDRAERTARETGAQIAGHLGLHVRFETAARSQPAPTDPRWQEIITGAAADLGFASRPVTSGAGHDCQILAPLTPAGMIFVPSIGGRSHVPEEDTAPEHLVAGAQVLLHTVLRADALTQTPGAGPRLIEKHVQPGPPGMAGPAKLLATPAAGA